MGSVKEIVKENEILQQKLGDAERKYSDLLQKNGITEGKFEQLLGQTNEYKTQLEDLRKALVVRETDLEAKSSIISTLQVQYQTWQDKCNQVSRNHDSLKEEHQQIIQQLAMMTNKLKKLEEENRQLQASLKEKENHCQQLDRNLLKANQALAEAGKEQFKMISDPSIYDIVIKAKTLHKLLSEEGWPIERMLKSELSTIHSVVVSVVGNYNKGKSYLLAKISDLPIASGYSIPTEGLSVVFPRKKSLPITFLDTQGQEAPIQFQNITPEERKASENSTDPGGDPEEPFIKDRKVCETLLQNFILNCADVIMIVVAQLTHADQLLIKRITTDAIQMRLTKRIVVVHNLFTLDTPGEIEEQIKKDILGVYNVSPQPMMEFTNSDNPIGTKYVEIPPSNGFEPKVIHIVMAKDDTVAGKIYNPPALTWLHNHITQTDCGFRIFDPVVALKEYLNANLGGFLKIPDVKKDVTKSEESKGEDFLTKDSFIIESKGNPSVLKSVVPVPLEFKGISINAMEKVVQAPSEVFRDFDIRLIEGERSYLIVRCELPGMTKSDIDAIQTQVVFGWGGARGNAIAFKGIKVDLKPVENEKQVTTLLNFRKFGPFLVTLPAVAENYQVVNERPEKDYKDGVAIFRWEVKVYGRWTS